MSVSTESRLIHVISAHGLVNASAIVDATFRSRTVLSRNCAMLEMESSGRNIFGADSGQPNALPRAWYDGEVTRLRYLYFRSRVNRGYVSNGVGPCQLTSVSLQREADKLGGCWKVVPNMIVGFNLIKQLVNEHGELEGFRHYNGSGPAAEAYAHRAQALRNYWHDLLTSRGLTR